MENHEIVTHLARRMSASEQLASQWLQATLEALQDGFIEGGVTAPHVTAPHVTAPHVTVPPLTPVAVPCRSVLRPDSPTARLSVDKDEIRMDSFPFRVGREARGDRRSGIPGLVERRSIDPAERNNDLYVRDMGRRLNVSREHFQIEQCPDGSFELIDRCSSLGTIVGSQHVGGDHAGGRCPLRHGDTIIVGAYDSAIAFRFIQYAD